VSPATPRCGWPGAKLIEQNEKCLVAGHYLPQSLELVLVDDPAI
jgi:hypothetical protein